MVFAPSAWGQPTEAARLFGEAFEKFRTGDYESARRGFQRGLEVNGDDAYAWLYYRETLLQLRYARIEVEMSRGQTRNRGDLSPIVRFVWEPDVIKAGEQLKRLQPTEAETSVLKAFYGVVPDDPGRYYANPYPPRDFDPESLRGKKICYREQAFSYDYWGNYLRRQGYDEWYSVRNCDLYLVSRLRPKGL